MLLSISESSPTTLRALRQLQRQSRSEKSVREDAPEGIGADAGIEMTEVAAEELEKGGRRAKELRVGEGEGEDALEGVDVRVVVAAVTRVSI